MKSMTPKVSIVIPVYNGSNYLKEAIDSALAQTYKNLEIIVVNDGSTDNGATEKIAKSYGNKIRYYAKPNGGVATALNLGIEKMTGEYFSWLSHDDLYYPDKVEKQINYLAGLKYPKVFLYANYSILRGDEITPVVHNHEMLVRKPKYSLLRGCVNGITVLIPKSILNEMGEFDSVLRATQDYDYWRRIEKKYDFVHMEDVISVTRLHAEQDTVVSPRVVEEGDKLWIDMIKQLSEKEKLAYESTIYNFYLEMSKFLETTPYKGTLEYSNQMLKQAESDLDSTTFNPKVSVVIPFFNRIEKTLRAIKSVQNQSYKNVEVVLINDASTDDIADIERLAKTHNNIRLFTQELNSGPAAARNYGIKVAKGEYIAFLDSDDEFEPTKIEKQLYMMSRQNLNISYTSYVRNDDGLKNVIGDPQLTGIMVPRIIRGCTIATPTVIIKKSLLAEYGILFNEKIRIGEDTCFWLDIAKHSEFLYIDSPLTIVNVDDNTHTQDYTKLIQGIQSILTYLLNDAYYSKYGSDIAYLCDYFFKINQENEIRRNDDLRNGAYLRSAASPTQHKLKNTKLHRRIKNSTLYKTARVMYRRGPRVALHTAVTRIKGK